MARLTLGAVTLLTIGGAVVALVRAQDASHQHVELTRYLQTAGQSVTAEFRPVSHSEAMPASGSPDGRLTPTEPIMLLAASEEPTGGLRSVLTRRSLASDPPKEPAVFPQATLETPAAVPQPQDQQTPADPMPPATLEASPAPEFNSESLPQPSAPETFSIPISPPAPLTGSGSPVPGPATEAAPQVSSRRTYQAASDGSQPPLMAAKSVPDAQPPASAATSGIQGSDTLNSSTGALLRVDTVGPEAVTIGEAALLSVRLSNLGATEAQNASVRVVVPKNLELISAEVEAGSTHREQESVSGSILVWAIDRIPARAERRMTLNVVPRTADPVELPVQWSVAPISTVARIQVQQPRLELSLLGPGELTYGDTKMFTVTVSNPGSGEAKQVALRLALGDESADTLQIGNIPAGVSRKYEVEVTARQAGQMTIRAVVQGANDLRAETQQRIQVRRADLKIEALGSAMKYAGSVGTYQVRVTNQGDAVADNVQAVVRLPASAKYVQGLENAQQQGNELAWPVGRLAAGEERTFRFFCQLNQEGTARFDIAIRNDGGPETVSSLVTRVEAIADLKMTVNDPKSPVPVGDEVLYEIQITNQGTKAATQVQVVAQFSDGIEPMSVEGAPAELVPGQAVFQPIARVNPGETIKLKVKAKADRDGNHVFRAELRCGDPEYRLVAEDSTTFFGDDLLGSPSESPSDAPRDARAPTWGSEAVTR
ncbi:MAG: hypothetical protein KJ000_19415 [Pirellulaceae bacterium]|nr:hypothetical protein [Pirellulaceae bacterium]